jgi:hypothetical protein
MSRRVIKPSKPQWGDSREQTLAVLSDIGVLPGAGNTVAVRKLMELSPDEIMKRVKIWCSKANLGAQLAALRKVEQSTGSARLRRILPGKSACDKLLALVDHRIQQRLSIVSPEAKALLERQAYDDLSIGIDGKRLGVLAILRSENIWGDYKGDLSRPSMEKLALDKSDETIARDVENFSNAQAVIARLVQVGALGKKWNSPGVNVHDAILTALGSRTQLPVPILTAMRALPPFSRERILGAIVLFMPGMDGTVPTFHRELAKLKSKCNDEVLADLHKICSDKTAYAIASMLEGYEYFIRTRRGGEKHKDPSALSCVELVSIVRRLLETSVVAPVPVLSHLSSREKFIVELTRSQWLPLPHDCASQQELALKKYFNTSDEVLVQTARKTCGPLDTLKFQALCEILGKVVGGIESCEESIALINEGLRRPSKRLTKKTRAPIEPSIEPLRTIEPLSSALTGALLYAPFLINLAGVSISNNMLLDVVRAMIISTSTYMGIDQLSALTKTRTWASLNAEQRQIATNVLKVDANEFITCLRSGGNLTEAQACCAQSSSRQVCNQLAQDLYLGSVTKKAAVSLGLAIILISAGMGMISSAAPRATMLGAAVGPLLGQKLMERHPTRVRSRSPRRTPWTRFREHIGNLFG